MASYEEELSRTNEEKERRRQQAAVSKTPNVLHIEDYQQPPHIKEEDKELCTNLEVVCLPGPEEADFFKLPLSGVSGKTDDHEEQPLESSQLRISPNMSGELASFLLHLSKRQLRLSCLLPPAAPDRRMLPPWRRGKKIQLSLAAFASSRNVASLGDTGGHHTHGHTPLTFRHPAAVLSSRRTSPGVAGGQV
ncbi:uncharacterized protein LOC133554652 isoform X2 [Nerophis ophidion]|uniref:uncharacterized protein LOC133554652 isoform X2 n=1 Tax=Nerophis ophidion TaxID=159077 RepID=UPI002AE0A1C0|nr:uncharacterized protein LOC133554652 isoform X2 [Nerophis ophidion]